jgi:hypothetical protein
LRGLLILLLFVLLLAVSVVLSFVLIGIPLLIVLIAAYFLLLIFGRTAVFYFAGSRIAQTLRLKDNAILSILLGVSVYTLCKFIPYLGVWLLLLMDLFAIGGGAGFVLRKRKSQA